MSSLLEIRDLKVNYGGIEALKGVSFDEIARITSENARRCYWKMDHAARPAQVG